MSQATREHYPQWLRDSEGKLLDQRRTGPAQVGLALSGGGIRSATFALGVLQTLAQRNLLSSVRYLSTVSGGGYIGTFLAAAYQRRKGPEGPGAAVEDMLTAFPESREMRWLRDCGRYLAPTGASSNWLAGAVLLRNWLTVLLVLAPAAFLLSFLGITLSSLVLYGLSALSTVDSFFPALLYQHSPLWVLPLLVLLAWALPSSLAYWFINQGHRDSLVPAKVAGIWVLGLEGGGAFALVLWRGQHLETLELLGGVLALTVLVYLVVARGKPPWGPSPAGSSYRRTECSRSSGATAARGNPAAFHSGRSPLWWGWLSRCLEPAWSRLRATGCLASWGAAPGGQAAFISCSSSASSASRRSFPSCGSWSWRSFRCS